MGCFLCVLAAQAMIPEMPILCNEGPTGSIFVARVGHIARGVSIRRTVPVGKPDWFARAGCLLDIPE